MINCVGCYWFDSNSTDSDKGRCMIDTPKVFTNLTVGTGPGPTYWPVVAKRDRCSRHLNRKLGEGVEHLHNLHLATEFMIGPPPLDGDNPVIVKEDGAVETMGGKPILGPDGQFADPPGRPVAYRGERVNQL